MRPILVVLFAALPTLAHAGFFQALAERSATSKVRDVLLTLSIAHGGRRGVPLAIGEDKPGSGEVSRRTIQRLTRMLDGAANTLERVAGHPGSSMVGPRRVLADELAKVTPMTLQRIDSVAGVPAKGIMANAILVMAEGQLIQNRDAAVAYAHAYQRFAAAAKRAVPDDHRVASMPQLQIRNFGDPSMSVPTLRPLAVDNAKLKAFGSGKSDDLFGALQ